MALTNSTSRYGAISKTFHWLMALGILFMIPLGFVASEMSEDLLATPGGFDESAVTRTAFLFSLHKTTGVVLFFAALARISWAATQARPGLLNAENRAEAFAAHLVHWMLYGAFIFVPLTGWLHHAATTGFAPIWWPFGQSLPYVPKDDLLARVFSAFHWTSIVVLAAALFFHVAGALKHHVIDRDATLRRMLPGTGAVPTPPDQRHSRIPFYIALAIWGAAIVLAAKLGLRLPDIYATQAAGATERAAPGSQWQVTDGTLGIAIAQLGNPVEGRFADWSAAITFQDRPDPGPAGDVTVTIAIASLTLGTVTDQAMGPDFFDTERFPTATFSGGIAKSADGYEADGMLTIRDQSVPVTLPFQLVIENGVATMTGQTRIDRLDFGIGSSLPDESSLGFAVTIDVELTALKTDP